MLINKDNKYYKNALKRESEFWEGTNSIYDHNIKPVLEFEQLNRYGDKNKSLIEFFRGLGKFDNVLSIGSGDGTFEFILLKEGLINNITFVDISQKALNKILSKAGELGIINRVKILKTDLNFIKLNENKFDLICCLNVLHHVINLEECIFELNKSLKPSGIILIDDFIGENKMQWQNSKIKFINFFNQIIFEKYKIKLNAIKKTNPKVLTNNCPFECIRSGEIVDIVNYYFGETTIFCKKYSRVFNFYSFLGTGINEKIIYELIDFENFFAINNYLLPTKLFGLFRKSNKPILNSELRTKEEIKNNIGLGLFNEKFILKFAEKIRNKNNNLYEILKKMYFLLRK